MSQASPSTPPPARRVDAEALLSALVLAPSSFSRNRFHGMFQDPVLGAVRRRASVLRGLVRQIQRRGAGTYRIEEVPGAFRLTLEIAELSYRRVAELSPVERDLVEYALARGEGAGGGAPTRARVEQLLSRLYV